MAPVVGSGAAITAAARRKRSNMRSSPMRSPKTTATSERSMMAEGAAGEDEGSEHGRASEENNSQLDLAEFHDSREDVKKRRVPRLFPKPWRKFCGRIVENERLQMFIVMLIAINAIMMGLATYDFIEDNPAALHAFQVADTVFLSIFTVELGLQFVHKDFRIFLDGWLTFDFVVIVMSWAFAAVQIIRAFRIFRAFRLIGRIQVLRSLVDAVISVIPRMAAIGMLLLLLFYIFGVLFTSLFMFTYDEGITEANYFGRLDLTLFTLFQVMTMDGWAEIAREIMAEYTWAWAPFVAFVIISGFVVVNLIIAVICDAIAIIHDPPPPPNLHSDDDSLSDCGDAEEEMEEEELPFRETLEKEVDDISRRLDTLMQNQKLVEDALEHLIMQLQLSPDVSSTNS